MNYLDRDRTSATVDGILKLLATGGLITTALFAPNAIKLFDKPLSKMFKGLDQRVQQREIRRIASYMKSRGLIEYNPRQYDHGVKITRAGKERLKKDEFGKLQVARPPKWDKKWRLIFFDIPIEKNESRHALTNKLKRMGFQQLQRSIWVHPFPCREETEFVGETLGIRKYITYVEVNSIDSEKILRNRFKHMLG